MAANTLSTLKPSVNNPAVRVFVRAAGLDFEEVGLQGQQQASWCLHNVRRCPTFCPILARNAQDQRLPR